MATLRDAGRVLIVVTNQPDVARGDLDLDEAVTITRLVVDTLGLDDAFICIHDRNDGCDCRKPAPRA